MQPPFYAEAIAVRCFLRKRFLVKAIAIGATLIPSGSFAASGSVVKCFTSAVRSAFGAKLHLSTTIPHLNPKVPARFHEVTDQVLELTKGVSEPKKIFVELRDTDDHRLRKTFHPQGESELPLQLNQAWKNHLVIGLSMNSWELNQALSVYAHELGHVISEARMSQAEKALYHYRYRPHEEILSIAEEKGWPFARQLKSKMGMHDELFADLIQVGVAKDGTAASLQAGRRDATRDFTLIHDLETWTSTSKYSALGPSRTHLWQKYLKDDLSTANFNRVIRAVSEAQIEELRKSMNGALEFNPKTINTSFIDEIDRQMGLLTRGKGVPPVEVVVSSDPAVWKTYASKFQASKENFEELLHSRYPQEVMDRVTAQFGLPPGDFSIFQKDPRKRRELLDWLAAEMAPIFSAKNPYDQAKPVAQGLMEYGQRSLDAGQGGNRVGVFEAQVAVCRDLSELAHVSLAKMGIESQMLPHYVEDGSTGHMALRVGNHVVDLNRAAIWKPTPKQVQNGWVVAQEKPEPTVVSYRDWKRRYSMNRKVLRQDGRYEQVSEAFRRFPEMRKMTLDPSGYQLVRPQQPPKN